MEKLFFIAHENMQIVINHVTIKIYNHPQPRQVPAAERKYASASRAGIVSDAWLGGKHT